VDTGLAVAVGGLEFELVFPLDFGEGTIEGTMSLTNLGNADAWPIFTITGPVTAPSIVNTINGRSLIFKNTTVIPAGQAWEVNTNHRTVTILGTNISKNSELLIRQWFPIPAGETHFIQFASDVYDPAARLNALVYNTDL
jgi:phage-related protein